MGKKKQNQIEFIMPDNIQEEGVIQAIEAYEQSDFKLLLYYIGILITGGLLYLVARWEVKMKILFTLRPVKEEDIVEKATYFLVYGCTEEVMELVQMEKKKMMINQQYNTYKLLKFRLYTYYIDPDCTVFKPIEFNVCALTNNEIREKHGKGIDEGDQYDMNVDMYGKNVTEIPPKSVGTIFIDEILSPFYIFQLFSVILWYVEEYAYYSTVILLTSLISIYITLKEAVDNYKKLKEMSYFETKVSVFRGVKKHIQEIDNNLVMQDSIMAEKKEISSIDLVPGDIIEVPENDIMPCDLILLNGQAVMNESMLTGESIPILKNALPYNDQVYDPQLDSKQCTLFAGTQCIETRYYMKGQLPVLALVSQTSFSTMKGELVRSILFPKVNSFQFYIDSMKFVGALSIISVLGFLGSFKAQLDGIDGGYFGVKDVVLNSLDLITVTVPPALPTCLSIGISFALSRLKKKQIFCISPPKVNIAGQVTTMCFDKTGTLTEEGLDLYGVRGVQKLQNGGNKFSKIEKNMGKLIESNQNLDYQQQENVVNCGSKKLLLDSMAACHSLTRVHGKIIGDPLDAIMFESTGWELEEQELSKFDEMVSAIVKPPRQYYQKNNRTNLEVEQIIAQQSVGIMKRFEFSSKLQRMSTIIKKNCDTKFKVFCKGSPEKILELSKKDTIPEHYIETLDYYAMKGFRVIAMGYKELELNYRQIQKVERDGVEFDLNFLGFIIMENKLKDATKDIIDVLHGAKIKNVMVTGDNVLTAISVARQCQIIQSHDRIYLGDLTGQYLKEMNSHQQHGEKGIENISWKLFESPENQEDFDSHLCDNEDLESSDNGNGKKELNQENQIKFIQQEMQNKSSRIQNESNQDLEQQDSINDIQEQETKKIQQNKPQNYNSMNNNNNNIQLLQSRFQDKYFGGDGQYSLAITGRAFSYILHEHQEQQHDNELYEMYNLIIEKAQVYARMKPEEKAQMIICQQNVHDKPTVGMCGDGANDCAALKTADVGISLSDAEASIAAPFTSKTQDISCVVIMLKEGRAALVTSFQCFKYMALYSMIQFSTVSMLYFVLSLPSDLQFLYWDLFIIIPLAFFMGLTEATDKLSVQVPGSKLVSFSVLSSVIGQTIIQFLFQFGAYFWLIHQDWYVSCPDVHRKYIQDLDPSGKQMQRCYEPTVLFWISNFQYIFICLAFSIGRPWRKPFYSNKIFSVTVFVLTILTVVVQVVRVDFISDMLWYLLQVKDKQGNVDSEMPKDVPGYLVVYSMVNCVVSLLAESYLFPSFNECYYKTQKEKQIKQRQQQQLEQQGQIKKQF